MFDLPEFAPDISYANFENLPFTDVVENLIPHATGYESVPSFRRIAKNPIDSNILGSFSFVRANDDGDVYNLVGTSTNIYRFGKNPKKYEDSIQYFYDISKDGGYNITDDTGQMNFLCLKRPGSAGVHIFWSQIQRKTTQNA